MHACVSKFADFSIMVTQNIRISVKEGGHNLACIKHKSQQKFKLSSHQSKNKA